MIHSVSLLSQAPLARGSCALLSVLLCVVFLYTRDVGVADGCSLVQPLYINYWSPILLPSLILGQPALQHQMTGVAGGGVWMWGERWHVCWGGGCGIPCLLHYKMCSWFISWTTMAALWHMPSGTISSLYRTSHKYIRSISQRTRLNWNIISLVKTQRPC